MLATFVATLGLLAAAPLPATVPMRLVNNHVFVDVSLNGAGPFRFIVDSGAGNLIDPAVAARIGASVHGHVRLVGVGSQTQTGGVTTVGSVRIGTANFVDQRFVVARTRATLSAGEGPSIDGLIGRGVIGSGITVFDYARRRLTFGATDAAIVNGGTTVLPLTSSAGLPQIPCQVAGVAGNCTVDTGSRLAISVLRPFARRHPEVVPASVSAPGVNGFGIGGATYGKLGLLSSVSFGAITLKRVVADFSLQRSGVFADAGTAANVGGAVWRRFTLAFDLAHRRIGLRPNADFDRPACVDRSGLFLVARAAAVAIFDVRRQTPAARAGLARDDIVLAADGRRYTPAMLPELRRLFEGAPDTLVQLRIVRGGDLPRTVALRLGDYL